MNLLRRLQAWRERRRTVRQIKRMVRAASKAAAELQRFVKATEQLGAAMREPTALPPPQDGITDAAVRRALVRPAPPASRRNGRKP